MSHAAGGTSQTFPLMYPKHVELGRKPNPMQSCNLLANVAPCPENRVIWRLVSSGIPVRNREASQTVFGEFMSLKVLSQELVWVAPYRRFARTIAPAKFQYYIEVEHSEDCKFHVDNNSIMGLINISVLDILKNCSNKVSVKDSLAACPHHVPSNYTAMENELRQAKATIEALRNTNAEQLAEINKLQCAVDGVDDALQSVYGNSTRVKEMRKNRRIK